MVSSLLPHVSIVIFEVFKVDFSNTSIHFVDS